MVVGAAGRQNGGEVYGAAVGDGQRGTTQADILNFVVGIRVRIVHAVLQHAQVDAIAPFDAQGRARQRQLLIVGAAARAAQVEGDGIAVGNGQGLGGRVVHEVLQLVGGIAAARAPGAFAGVEGVGDGEQLAGPQIEVARAAVGVDIDLEVIGVAAPVEAGHLSAERHATADFQVEHAQVGGGHFVAFTVVHHAAHAVAHQADAHGDIGVAVG